ncbi:Shedu immune nuclease family protein [Metabacillus sp. 84]|uniref:Shedu immune nuclease family protein n=1 Tax=Metabacillus sp. 84 TaxID=3404705 RepID=UPI003CF8404A
MEYTLNSTSRDSAMGNDIILREGPLIRLIFRPQIVNNQQNSDAPVNGCFIYQKKKKSDDWEDFRDFDLSSLKAYEGIKLELKSDEMLKLMTEADVYYKIYKEYGIVQGRSLFTKADNQLQKVIEMFKKDSSLFETLLDENKQELVKQTFEWMANTKNSEDIISRLLEVKGNELDQLNNLIGITNIRKLLKVWQDNSDNNDEEFWQGVFTDNAWVLSQIFASPMLLFEDKAFVGGKGIGNKGGKVVDFMFKNDLSNDVALIEIKTPSTYLLSSKYRQNIYSIHSDLTGAIVQVLGYKESLQREYTALRSNSEEDFKVFNPICVVIAGKMNDLEEHKLQSFEWYRKEMKSVVILTFDELFHKVNLLLELLSEN